MKNNSRTRNAFLNISLGYIAQIGILVLSFVGRKIFLMYLSADYLGINGLYSNILTMISLPELGLDTAMVYSLYKPVAERDITTIASLIRFFRKIYFALSSALFLIGLMVVPFLKYIITSDMPLRDLTIYYLMFLTNTIVTYFVAHKVALLSACQEQRIHKLVNLTSNFILQIIHIVVLIFTRNYYLYVGATVLTTILSNMILSWECSRIHENVIKYKGEYVRIDTKAIIERIKATFLYKIGVVLINSTDNILISVLVSTLAVGLYSNYYVVISAVQAFISIITTSLISGIGNFAVNKDKNQCGLFNTMLLFYHVVSCMGFVGFSLLLNDFVSLWIGKAYLLDNASVLMISINFYLANGISPIWMFREANGLFVKVKYLILIRASLNIIFSVLFGKIWGVFGILFATALSLILTSFWYEPKILYNDIFNCSVFSYWKRQIKYFIATIISFIICSLILRLISENTFAILIVKGLLILLISFSIFFVISKKTDEYKQLENRIKNGVLKKICKKQ